MKGHRANQLLNPAELNHQSEGAKIFQIQFEVAEPLDKVWAVISDSDLIRRKMKMGKVAFTFLELEEGGTLLEGEYKVPFGKAHFFEKPFEWVAGQYSLGVRLFDKGPLRYASVEFSIEPIDSGHTRVKAEMKLVLGGPLKFLVLKKMQRVVDHFPQTIRDLLKNIQSEEIPGFEVSLRAVRDKDKFQNYRQGMSKLKAFPHQWESVADFAARSNRRFMQRLRPYEIADFYKLPRQETLAFFLEGTLRGIFNLNWDLLCPSCRGPKKQSKSLRDLDKKVHCEACGIQFDVIDSKDVELSFAFAGELAVQPETVFCIGNPGRSPSIHVQLPFAPQEQRIQTIILSGQSYRLRSMQSGQLVRIKVDPEGLAKVDASLIEDYRANNRTLLVRKEFSFHWLNKDENWQVLRFDCLDPNHNAATADQIASLPAYQRYFGDDALRPGMDLGVGHLVFMFSDIRSSTQLYQDLGDSKAFRLVQDHFAVMDALIKKEQGIIVKTIGDAVMASFLDEISAVSAALAIQKHYETQGPHQQLPGLKIALHGGPCIMVNLNDHMDYFGTTVNTCSRLLDMAAEEDIIISEMVLENNKVQAFLGKEAVMTSREEEVLRGLQSSQVFYRIRLNRTKSWKTPA